jgi:hypothetical protein
MEPNEPDEKFGCELMRAQAPGARESLREKPGIK